MWIKGSSWFLCVLYGVKDGARNSTRDDTGDSARNNTWYGARNGTRVGSQGNAREGRRDGTVGIGGGFSISPAIK